MSSAAVLTRLRRPRWRDPRLLVGILLILVSVLLGGLLAARLSATTTVLVAREDIVVGDVLVPEDFTTAEVRLGDQTPLYASGLSEVPEGATALVSVRSGELVPRSSIGQGGGADLRPIVIDVDRAVAASVQPGSAVELWRTTDGDDEGSATAELLVQGATVRSVLEGSSLGMRSQSVEVQIGRAHV